MTDILIKNGYIITMDKNNRIIPEGSCYIVDDRIVNVGKNIDLDLAIKPEFVIDAKHKIVLPGFVNTHAHLPSQYLRGASGLLQQGLYQVIFPISKYVNPKDSYLFGIASCAEAIFSGTTTVVETHRNTTRKLDDFARAVEKTGLRVILGEMIPEVDLLKLKDNIYEHRPEIADTAFKRAISLHKKWANKADGRITAILAPHAPDITTPETYLKCKEASEKYSLNITTHLSATWQEEMHVKKEYGKTSTEHLYDLGLLDDHLTAAHCTYISEKDTQLIRESGMKILHCPRSFALNGMTVPLKKWLDIDIPVGLGTDSEFHSINETMRAAIYSARFRARGIGGAESMTVNRCLGNYEVIKLATMDGACVMDVDDEVGSLEPGKKADVICFDMLNPHHMPSIDPLSNIALYGTSHDVDTVIINGKILKENRFLKIPNINKVLSDAQEKVDEIWKDFLRDNIHIKNLIEKNASKY